MLLFGRLDAAEGLDQAAARRRPAQRQHPHARDARARHRLRFDRRLSPGRGTRVVPRSARARECAAEDHPLQQQPGRQLHAGDDGRQLPGRIAGRQDAVRQRLVVSRSEGRDRVADQRAVQRRAARTLRGHADRFALVHVLPAPRVFPPRALQHAGRGNGARRAAERSGAGRQDGRRYLLRERAQVSGLALTVSATCQLPVQSLRTY